MATWRVNNATALGGEVCAVWQANHAYALGARVVCTLAYGTVARRAWVYQCTTAGTSHATTEPVWPASGTIAEGPDTLVWTTRNPNDGDWDNASCILHYVLNHTAIAAGDFVYIHNAHSENTALAAVYTINGTTTYGNPIKIICVNKADDTLSTGAVIANNHASYGLYFYYGGYSYGVTYKSTQNNIIFAGTTPDCSWILEGNGVIDLLQLIGATNYLSFNSLGKITSLILLNGNINFAATGQYIKFNYNGSLIWKGGSVVAAAGVTKMIDSGLGDGFSVDIEDVDLSGVGNGANARSLIDVSDKNIFNVLFSRCKLSSAAGFTNTIGTWVNSKSGKVRLHHCSSANVTYDFYEQSYEGSVQDETTVVRTGGASDGATPQAWKMISSANVKDNYLWLESPPIHSWTLSTTEKTFTVECIWDSATNIQNDEVWMEFEYPINNTDGLGGFARDKCAILAAPADKTGSAEVWGDGGLANPNKLKCRVTVTPGKAGPITARICLAKASTTIYVDPKITES